MKACDIEFTPTRETGVTKRALEIEKTPTQALDFVYLIASRKGCVWPQSRIKRVEKTSGRFFSSNFPLRSYTSWDLWCLIPCILSSSVVIASLNKPDSHNKKKKKNKDEKINKSKVKVP